jgi:hypothetical protein
MESLDSFRGHIALIVLQQMAEKDFPLFDFSDGRDVCFVDLSQRRKVDESPAPQRRREERVSGSREHRHSLAARCHCCDIVSREIFGSTKR